MQNRSVRAGRDIQVLYRERLTPSLWAVCAAAVLAPMVMMVFVPLNKTLALAIGAVVAIAVVVLVVFASPLVVVADGVLHAGRAHVSVELLGDAEQFTGDDARQARGPGLDARSWHLIRSGIDGLVRVPLHDPDDPVSSWVISTRTPDRLAAALRKAAA